MIPDDVAERAKEAVSRFKICDHCLGRAFLEVEGRNNEERGRKIREAIGAEHTPPEECYFCGGAFARINDFADRAARELRRYVFKTFRIGTKIPKWMVAREEELWETVGVKNTETIKKHLNREIGKLVKKRIKARYDAEEPDVEAVINVENGKVKVISHPLYLYGRYRKEAGIPVAKWPCPLCNGRGCEACDYTGRKERITVEYILSDVLLGVTGGKETKIHTPGTEPPEFGVYGKGRPFIIEIVEPAIRYEEWGWLIKEINAHGGNLVEITELRRVPRACIRQIKEMDEKTVYRVEVEGEIEDVEELAGRTVYQEVGQGKIRKGKILYITGNEDMKRRKQIYITMEGDINILRFIKGDRTNPSLRDHVKGKVLRVDIADILGEDPC